MTPGVRSPAITAFIVAVSIILPLASWRKWVPLDFTESLGFSTGAVCVWLVARKNIWNFPIGLANNIFFAVLFWRAGLFADLGLQGVYFILGIYGWWKWHRGGTGGAPLPVSRTTRKEWRVIGFFIIAATAGLHQWLLFIQGSSPFWDALTTALCLAAQYLLGRKRLENWFLWIAADIIYVPLYFSKMLPLTAVLYAGFLCLCIAGWRHWRKELHP